MIRPVSTVPSQTVKNVRLVIIAQSAQWAIIFLLIKPVELVEILSVRSVHPQMTALNVSLVINYKILTVFKQ